MLRFVWSLHFWAHSGLRNLVYRGLMPCFLFLPKPPYGCEERLDVDFLRSIIGHPCNPCGKILPYLTFTPFRILGCGPDMELGPCRDIMPCGSLLPFSHLSQKFRLPDWMLFRYFQRHHAGLLYIQFSYVRTLQRLWDVWKADIPALDREDWEDCPPGMNEYKQKIFIGSITHRYGYIGFTLGDIYLPAIPTLPRYLYSHVL